jgi:hypothetical protein
LKDHVLYAYLNCVDGGDGGRDDLTAVTTSNKTWRNQLEPHGNQ